MSDAVAKPLAIKVKQQKQRAISAQFIGHTRQVAHRSGFPVFEISERQQRGTTFGQRFADAFRQIFERGYRRVIAIGNDCPGLTANDLRAAAQKLDSSRAVFGPAADGGAYLVALRSDAFAQTDFATLEWQTERTLSALKTYAEDDCGLLPEKTDVDSAADLQRLLRRRAFPILLKKRLLLILQTAPSGICTDRPVSVPLTVWLLAQSLRGPPALS